MTDVPADFERSEALDAPSPPAHVKVSFRLIIVVLGTVSLGAIITLVILATTNNAGALTTLALILAIISFAAQLVVTGVQSNASNVQHRQMTGLSDKATIVLNKIDHDLTQMRDLQNGQVKDMFGVLREVLISSVGDAVASAAETVDDEAEDREPERAATLDSSEPGGEPIEDLDGVGGEGQKSDRVKKQGEAKTSAVGSLKERLEARDRAAFTEAVARNLESTLDDSLSAILYKQSIERRRNNSPASTAEALRQEALTALTSLSNDAQRQFVRYADEISTEQSLVDSEQVFAGSKAPPPWVKELSRAGLVRISSKRGTGGRFHTEAHVTRDGRAAAAALRKPLHELTSSTARLVTAVRSA